MKKFFCFLVLLIAACTGNVQRTSPAGLSVIFDTDTNNELDDQHAMAYLLFNEKAFNVLGITVNTTRGGGNINEQYAEAVRIARLCKRDSLLILKGANSSFDSIQHTIDQLAFDGSDAVSFIIEQARKYKGGKLTAIAVGKLTNLALALKKAPDIEKKVRIVWLGSNYPDPGEYNLDNDTASVNYVLSTNIDLEIVTVRYGKAGGSDEVRLTQAEVNAKMPGKGPYITEAVTGRHGGTFHTFGDYSVNLFKHIHYNSNPPSRALYDMVAVAVVKDPSWGTKTEIHGPILKEGKWVEQPANPRKVMVWSNFDKAKILNDFYETIESSTR